MSAERTYAVPESLLSAALQLLQAAHFPTVPAGQVAKVMIDISQLQPVEVAAPAPTDAEALVAAQKVAPHA